MKKFLSITFCLIVLYSTTIAISATSDIDWQLKPYLEIIEKVNEETGASIYVPEEEKENVYNYYKDMSLEEFEKTIKSEYLSILNQNQESDASENKVSQTDTSSPWALTENIVQTKSISYDSYMSLYSTVLGTGNPTTYKYKTIQGVSTGPQSGNTGYYYFVKSASFTFNSTRTSCTASTSGVLKNAAGLTLTAIKYQTITFYAN